ncbi:MAG: hypothetical protein N3B11_03375 [Coriobacteriia bacterium]|nr:hypothetical protein [Coriobacteriia bacterium]
MTAEQNPFFEFEDPHWFICNHALQIVNLDDPLESAPEDSGDWPPFGTGVQSRKALEEVMESILVVNLPGLLRERVQFLYRGGDTWGVEDITGLDNLGRFHLFELKRDGLSEKVTEQLATYLLGNLFRSGDDYLDEKWSLNQQLLTVGRWALYLAAALANTRTSNLGPDDVNQWHPAVVSGSAPPFTRTSWRRLSDDTKYEGLYEWGTEAMVAKATKTRGVTDVDATMVYEWAERLQERLGGSKPVRPRVRPGGQVVIWLVGRSFDKAVLDRVRLWRRAGIDARCLMMEARQSLRTGQWVVRVQRERFPEREQALNAIARMQAAIEADPKYKELALEFYDTRAPSNPDLSSGGTPLRDKSSVLLKEQTGKEAKIFQAATRDT